MSKQHLETTSLDKELVIELFPDFFKELSTEWENILKYFNLNDHERVGELIHNVIGTAQTFGAIQIENKAKHIETIINGNFNSSLLEAVEDLRIEIREIKEAYESNILFENI